ncbi:MAG: glycosyltransferase [Candidatus Hodarchaeota archaeon]
MKIKTDRKISVYKFNPSMETKNVTSFELDNSSDVFLFVVQSYPDHYTGGRYHIFEIALALCELGHQVVWLCNCIPTCLESFYNYECLKNLTVVVQHHGDPTPNIFSNEYVFKNVVGTPLGCINCVASYKLKHIDEVVYYQIILVVPPLASQYRQGADINDNGPGWFSIKESLKIADVIITQTELNREWITKWLGIPKKRIHLIPPAINDKVANKFLNSEKNDEVVFISRFVSYKNPHHVLEALARINYTGKITMIGGAGGLSYSQLYDYAKKTGLNLRIIEKCNDYEKFKILSKCRLLLYPTLWEDFGMPPIEAGYYGIPTVTYENPTFKTVYRDLLSYAKRNDITELSNISKKLLNKPQLNFELRHFVLENFTFNNMVKNVKHMLITREITSNMRRHTSILFDIVTNCVDRGVGDVLLTTPIIRALKERFPNSTIHYYAHEHNYPVLLNNQYIDKVISNPKDLDSYYSYHLKLERKLEDYSIERNKHHRLDSLAELFSVILKDKDLILNLTKEEIENSKKYIPKNNKKNIAIMFKSTSHYRNWPIERFRELVDKLKKKYNVIMLCKDYEPLFDDVYNLSGRLAIRELCCVIYLSDLLVSLDTAGIHIAGALDKTCIGLFGNIPAKYRSEYYKNHISIEGSRCRDLCWDMQDRNAKFLKMCFNKKIAKCMLDISVTKVYREIRKIL